MNSHGEVVPCGFTPRSVSQPATPGSSSQCSRKPARPPRARPGRRTAESTVTPGIRCVTLRFGISGPDVHGPHMPTRNTHASHDLTLPSPDLTGYRDAVADLLVEIGGHAGPDDVVKPERVVAERIADPEVATVPSATPNGLAEAAEPP